MIGPLSRWEADALDRAAKCWQKAEASPAELARARLAYRRRAQQAHRSDQRGLLASALAGLAMGSIAVSVFAWQSGTMGDSQGSGQQANSLSNSRTIHRDTPERQGTARQNLAAGEARGNLAGEPLLPPESSTAAAERALEAPAVAEAPLRSEIPLVVETRTGEERVFHESGFVVLSAGEPATLRVAGERRKFMGPGVLELRIDPDQACGWSFHFQPDTHGSRLQPLAEDEVTVEPDSVQSNVALRFAASETRQSSAAARAEQGAWTRTAQALRASDYAAASQALAELERSPSAEVRDAARLSRAQLLIAQKRTDGVRAMLQALSTSSSPVIRRRATEMSRQLDTP